MKPGDRRGFLHRRIGGLVGAGLGVIGGRVGGNLGGILGTAGQAVTSFSRPTTQTPSSFLTGLPSGSRVQFPTPGIGGAVQRFLPGGKSGFTTLPPGLTPKGPGGLLGALPGVPGGVSGFAVDSANGQCPAPVLGGNRRINAMGQQACPGFHWNQSTYVRLGGPCSSKPAGTVVKGTEQVKNRRKFNTANGPARKRAIARLQAGEGDCKAALKALGYRTISKQSSRELRSRGRRGHR